MLLLLFCFVGLALVSAQTVISDQYRGLPFIQNLSPRDYIHLVQNFEHTSILQDRQGAMLIGSHGGVLRYNGNTWQLIETPNQSLVWSLAKGEAGRIYVGATDDLGFLAPDATGKTRFVSLLPHLPKEIGSLGEVWHTIVTPEGVYYKTNKYLMRLHGGKFKVWQAETVFGGVQWLDHKLVVQVYTKGLFVINNGKLKPYIQNTVLANDRINFMLPLSTGNWLIGTASHGLFHCDGQKVWPVNPTLQEYLIDKGLFHGVLLSNGDVALATTKGGIVIIDQKEAIKSIVNKESGLPTNTVFFLAKDQQDGLWVSMEKGLSRIRLGSAFSLFNEQNGIRRETYTMATHQGQAYAGTTDGVFVLQGKSVMDPSATFKRVGGFDGSVWSLQSVGTALLMSSDQGLHELQNGQVVSLPTSGQVWENYSRDLQPWSLDSTIVFKASRGLFAYRSEGSTWINIGNIGGIQEVITQIVESSNGNLWLVTKSGVVRVVFPKARKGFLSNDWQKEVVIHRYGASKGLPAGKLKLYSLNQDVLAQVGESDFKLYRFNKDQDKFERLENFGSQYGLSSCLVHPAFEHSTDANLWLWVKKPGDRGWQLCQVLKNPGGGYTVRHSDFSGITEPLKHFVHQQGNEAVWFAGVDGLVRYSFSEVRENTTSFPTLLEKVLLPSDSVLYPTTAEVRLPYEYNTLRFEYAAPSFDGAGENRFQYRLDGYDQGWSAWSPDPFKEYTRIPEGTYTFRVRARNAQGVVGQDATYTFTVLPPWYRTAFMYLLYILGSIALFWWLIRWRSSRIEAEKTELERVVQLRTREVADKNILLSKQTRELATQAEKLQELDQVKTRFYANISHEFRTPLTLILNNLLDKLTNTQKAPAQEQVTVGVHELKVMSRNAQRLLQLINQLLDLSKLESGKMVLKRQDGDLRQVLRVVHASFTSLAEYQRVNFELQLPDDPLLCQFDEDKLEKILYNLLSNAFKFTPADGSVLLKAEVVPSYILSNSKEVLLTVQDSGHGILPDQLSHVFDRFFQGEQHYTDAQGTGIGLALVKELVELHQGQITVASEPGKGACFQVRLPLIPALSTPLVGTVDTSEAFKELVLPVEVYPIEIGSDFILAQSGSARQEDKPIVLVVEDNHDLRDYIRNQLAPLYQVLESTNGAEGLALAKETIPDLIISDRMMPVMDGNELCTQLKSQVTTSHIPVILLTALASVEEKVKGLETGADDYLTKPFDARELHVRVQNLIKSRQKLREYFGREIRLEPTKKVVQSVEEKFLKQVMQIVEDRMGDSDFSVDELSREVGMSRVHLHRKLKALTDKSPSEFIRMIRLKQAAQLLDARAGNIAEVAYQVGFNNLSYFSKCFREQFGLLPNEYSNRPAETI
ncbi:ATP-binding protein [Telluribacter humicola]|uniref:ATP-binding protein n=1 Tax=Telluribacter humicola TaxID=1720261 RepID=UPI001A978B10|nr:ATP-binding protein [Telluribacter humicola]